MLSAQQAAQAMRALASKEAEGDDESRARQYVQMAEELEAGGEHALRKMRERSWALVRLGMIPSPVQ